MDYIQRSSGLKPLTEKRSDAVHMRELKHRISLSAVNKGRIEIKTLGESRKWEHQKTRINTMGNLTQFLCAITRPMFFIKLFSQNRTITEDK